jgi:uncharacterized Tic20 family protein
MDHSTTLNGAAKENRTFATLSHIGGLFTSWVGPLVIFLIKKSDPSESFATDQAKEALNFQINVFLICMLLVFSMVGVFLMFIPILWNLIFSIIAAVKASNGVVYRYPFILRLIK